MLTKSFKSKSKTKAQAMVEFALVLPILLLVVYGLLESGRLLFIFASVNTASRQAARYGSAIGGVDTNGDGTLDINHHYEDCAGITAAANNVAFIAPFTNINITYDGGLNTDGSVRSLDGIDPDPATTNYCPSLTDGQVNNGDRVNVYVSAVFTPIIPLIPLGPMTIESSASRTIVGEISIHVTAQPGNWDPPSGTSSYSISLAITPSPATYSYVGDKVEYTYKITNTGEFEINGTFKVTDNTFGTDANCSGAAAFLAPGDWTTCTYTYTIQQSDIDNGSLTNQARAYVTGATSEPANATITLVGDPKLALLSITPDPSEAFAAQPIEFTYEIENTGNVALSAFSVIGNNFSTRDFSCPIGTLQPGDIALCTGYHDLTATEINNGSLDYIASIQAGDGTISNPESAFVLTTRLFLVGITPNVDSVKNAKDPIVFTYEFQNKGDAEITSLSITGTYVQNVSCSLPLAAGGTTTCTSTYTMQQPDIDANAGGSFTLEASATAGAVTSNKRTASVRVDLVPSLSLTISTDAPHQLISDPSKDLMDVLGTVHYTYTIENTGNISLSGFVVTNNNLSDGLTQTLSCANPTTLLAPKQTRECTLVDTDKISRDFVDNTDLEDGPYINEATVVGYYGAGNTVPVTSDKATHILYTFEGPRIKLYLTPSKPEAAKGEFVSFKFLVKNTGSVYLADFTLEETENLGTDVYLFGCPDIAGLEVGKTWTCSPTHQINTTEDTVTTWVATGYEDLAHTLPTAPSQATATVTVIIPTGCAVSLGELSLNPFSIEIFNNNPSETITVSEITLYWNVTGTNLQNIYAGNDPTPVWTGNKNKSPATIPSSEFDSPIQIAGGSSKALFFEFNSDYNPFDITHAPEFFQVTFSNLSCTGQVFTAYAPR